MSRFLSRKLKGLAPYVPGEQPRDRKYVKLNTNENPAPLSPRAAAVLKGGTDLNGGTALSGDIVNSLNLYSDPQSLVLRRAIAEYYGVDEENVTATNGSDEALAFCFAAFGGCGCVFPDITYGFYKVFAKFFSAEYEEIPLREDFSVNVGDYEGVKRTIFLANPNAQTGIYLPLSDIERIVETNPENVVVIDEAYIDFGGESAVKLIKKYNNLAVVQTFSKSRSLAGARIGFAMAGAEITGDLQTVRNSFNPYNVNSLSAALATAAIRDKEYFGKSVKTIVENREKLNTYLKNLGFITLPSLANFILAKSERIGGGELYKRLKAKGVLVRHFPDERIKDFVRITVGSEEQIGILINAISEIFKEGV